MQEDDKYSAALKSVGLKNTKHRHSILAILERCESPITAEEIFLELKQQQVAINLSSVYRTLENLVIKEMVVKSTISGESKALFELKRTGHRHRLICSGCKKMIAIEGCPVAEYEKSLQQQTGFRVTGHKLEIYGYCHDCEPNKK
ncbi:MAG: transcriptional repressor [Pelosinus sp.]|nr:transcriptional repressor [Pelosinus sp.]